MWTTAVMPNSGELICYVFHHWSGHAVDRSQVVVTRAGCTPLPRAEYDGHGLPEWFLFRSVPKRLCSQAGSCTRCVYALGEVVSGCGQAGAGGFAGQVGFSMAV